MKLLLLILSIVVFVLLVLLCLVDAAFVTLPHIAEFVGGGLALLAASFLPIP
jgi:hypothetical protein